MECQCSKIRFGGYAVRSQGLFDCLPQVLYFLPHDIRDLATFRIPNPLQQALHDRVPEVESTCMNGHIDESVSPFACGKNMLAAIERFGERERRSIDAEVAHTANVHCSAFLSR